MVDINRIVNLSNDLRSNGVNVSVRTTQTAFDTCDLLEGSDRKVLKSALKSVYVKNKYDIPKFNKAFEEAFALKPAKEEVEKVNPNKVAKNNFNHSNKMRIKKIPKNAKSKKKNNNDLKNKSLEELMGAPPMVESDENLEKDAELLNKDLTKLNDFDPRILELCQELGRRIANKRSRRKSKSNTNKIDIRKTIRTNLKYGGTTLDLIKAKPRPRRNQHLFLDDISGSCEWISSWFFMLMYSCQSSFKDSRTFEFDNKTIETTDALKSKYLLESFVSIRDMRMKNAMVHGTSNMYSAFKSFMRQVKISNKTYIIILSDCRDWAGPKVDGIPASVDLVRKMAHDAKKVIILNPEDRYKWDVVDSCVSLYRDAGAQVYEVNTLNQLADFVANMN
ncbi:MAG: VWA domain-containing protein [Methanobrevibacter wolinii]|nr:VWA domain-containing protein [Methanobrevibacter wolinii]